MAKLRVTRKGYTRKAYARKDGTRVKASRVGGSTFKIKDRGKRGRTPKSQRWYHPKVHTGWEKGMGETQRRRLVLSSHNGDYLSSARAMLSLSNTTTDSVTKSEARADADYFFRMHEKTGR